MKARIFKLGLSEWRILVEHLCRQLPDEACGLLAGRNGRGQKVYRVENELHSPWEYRMEPKAQVRAMLEMEAAGLELVGIFHSHPAGPPTPSAADVAQAYYPEAVYLICAPDENGEWRARGFKIEAGVAQEMLIMIEENQA